MDFFITRSKLKHYESGLSVRNESVASLQARATAFNSYEADVAIFLSHSHKDRDLIQPNVAFLRSHGVKIYVDWMDEGMPDVI